MDRAVDCAIRAAVREGQRLPTPTGRGEFVVAQLGSTSMVLLLGAKQARTPLRWAALEGVPDYLRGRGWVRVGGVFGESSDGTFDAYLKYSVQRATANWVSVVLELAGLVDLDRGRPMRVRLREPRPA